MKRQKKTTPADQEEASESPGGIKMAPVQEGQTLGKYRVLEPLGRGGMARVYRGYHPQLDRYVAIKVLPVSYTHLRAHET